MPMKEIAARLGVSSASVHLWTSDIVITAQQAAENHRRAIELRGQAWSERNRKRRLEYQQEGRLRARESDPLHQAGCMLYWAEGWKSRNTFLFANSDVEMVRLMRRFLTEGLGAEPAKLSLSLNVYTNNGLAIYEIENHWLRALDLPHSCLRKHVLNHYPTSSSGRRPNRLPHGVCRLKLGSTRIVQHIYGAIQEYAGFDEPRWLD